MHRGASEHHIEKEPKFLNEVYFDALVFTPYAGGGELAAELVSARHKPSAEAVCALPPYDAPRAPIARCCS